MSKLFSLNFQDAVKSGFVFVMSAVITTILEKMNGGIMDWNEIGKVALVATLTYILKQLGTDENGKLGGVV